MKHLISSVTIGACLLLSSAGDVFAQTGNPHGGPANLTANGGQLGTFGGASGVANCGAQSSPPGQGTAMDPNTHTNSPFPTGGIGSNPNPGSAAGNYAGAGSGNYGTGNVPGSPNPHANSQYDNAPAEG